MGHQHSHSGMFDAARTIVRNQGASGLYAGLPAFILRCMALVGAQMTTYDIVKAKILGTKTMENGPLLHSCASAVAAGVACLSMQPFDLVGARMMNQPVTDGKGVLYSGPVDCLVKTVVKEGPLALYKGAGANYLRMGPQYILTFVFFEKLMDVSKSFREEATSS